MISCTQSFSLILAMAIGIVLAIVSLHIYCLITGVFKCAVCPESLPVGVTQSLSGASRR